MLREFTSENIGFIWYKGSNRLEVPWNRYYYSRITHLHLLPFFAILGNCCVLHTTKRDSLILRSVSTLASYIFIWKIMKKRETGHGKCWTFFFICRTGFFVRKYGGTLHKDRIYNYIWCSNVFIPIRFYYTIVLDIDFEGRNSLYLGLERSATYVPIFISLITAFSMSDERVFIRNSYVHF